MIPIGSPIRDRITNLALVYNMGRVSQITGPPLGSVTGDPTVSGTTYTLDQVLPKYLVSAK